MPTLESVKAELAALGTANSLVVRREVRDLPKILWEDERILGALQGMYAGGNGLLVATDRRLLFVDKKLIGNRVKVEDFPYEKVSSIQYQLKILFAEVTIFATGNRAEITQISPKGQARTFCESVRARMTAGPSKEPAHATGESETESEFDRMASRLERLGALRDQGLLSELEFAEQKAHLLSGKGPD